MDEGHHEGDDWKGLYQYVTSYIYARPFFLTFSSEPVVSSCNIPTIPLVVAQAMNPAPRPPSPGARAATQKALRRENPNQLSSRDARVLMGLPGAADPANERKGVQTFFAEDSFNDSASIVTTPKAATTPAPPRPSREMRRMNSTRSTVCSHSAGITVCPDVYLFS
jgi:hypothetical protein